MALESRSQTKGEEKSGLRVSAVSLAGMYSRAWMVSCPKNGSFFPGAPIHKVLPSSRQKSPWLRVTMASACEKGTSWSSRERLPGMGPSMTRFRPASWAMLWRTSRTGASFTDRETVSSARTQRTGVKIQKIQKQSSIFMATPLRQKAGCCRSTVRLPGDG